MAHSIIIEESLKKPEVLDRYRILRTKFSEKQNWHLHIVEVKENLKDFIRKIQEAMVTEEPYYFHIYDEGTTLIVVFKDRVFNIDPSDQSTWKEARKYGADRLKIPSEQLDFYPTRPSEEDSWFKR